MIKVLLLIAVQATAPLSALPSNTCRDGSAMNMAPVAAAVKQCTSREAIALERSGERADIVATAVVSKCDPAFKAVRAYVEQCQGWDVANVTDAKLRSAMVGGITQQVVEIRARRHR